MSLPTKRSSATSSSSYAPSPSSSSAASAFLPMKKAKSQAVAAANANTSSSSSPTASAEPDTVFDDGIQQRRGETDIVVAANLSRKKAQPPQPAKKLVIKLNKAKPTLPTNFEEETWAKLKSAIIAIFLKQPTSCDLETLYQAVNNLCLHKMGGKLYERIEKECETHISAALKALVGQSPDLGVFLSLIERCWQDLCDQILMIRDIALYLDRTYVKQSSTARSLWDMGLQLFRKHLHLNSEVEYKTVTGLLRVIDKER